MPDGILAGVESIIADEKFLKGKKRNLRKALREKYFEKKSLGSLRKLEGKLREFKGLKEANESSCRKEEGLNGENR